MNESSSRVERAPHASMNRSGQGSGRALSGEIRLVAARTVGLICGCSGRRLRRGKRAGRAAGLLRRNGDHRRCTERD